jgi:hypothetical protein
VPITKSAQKHKQNTKETTQNQHVEKQYKKILGQKTYTLTKHR